MRALLLSVRLGTGKAMKFREVELNELLFAACCCASSRRRFCLDFPPSMSYTLKCLLGRLRHDWKHGAGCLKEDV